jgi:hypothetical protein
MAPEVGFFADFESVATAEGFRGRHGESGSRDKAAGVVSAQPHIYKPLSPVGARKKRTDADFGVFLLLRRSSLPFIRPAFSFILTPSNKGGRL